MRATGKKPIGARWVDVSKQDKANPKRRSRFVATGIKISAMPGLYAAAPPLECLRVIASSAMIEDTDSGDMRNPKRVMVCDVSRAYFYAPAIRPVYVKMVEEDFEPGDENTCGRFNAPMHGTRGAALNWHHFCNDN